MKREKKAKKSLRNSESGDNAQYDLVSTPEFKAHVAKKLSSYLDRIYDTRSDDKPTTCTPTAGDLGGITLLRSSKIRLSTGDSEDVEKPKKSQKLRQMQPSSDSSDEEDERNKFASVCVSGNNILDHGEGAFKRVQPSKHKSPCPHKDTASLASEMKETPSKKKKKKAFKNGRPMEHRDSSSAEVSRVPMVEELPCKKKKYKDNG